VILFCCLIKRALYCNERAIYIDLCVEVNCSSNVLVVYRCFCSTKRALHWVERAIHVNYCFEVRCASKCFLVILFLLMLIFVFWFCLVTVQWNES